MNVTSSSVAQSTGEEGSYTSTSNDQQAKENTRGFRGRGDRGSGRGRNTRKPHPQQQREKAVPGPISAPINIDPTKRPTPKFLATQASELRNDPMWQDFAMEGFDGLTAYRPGYSFSVTTEGFHGLIDHTYETLNSASQVNADNHAFYESLAAPKVLVLRIQHDLAYTMDQAAPRLWNLPEDLRPEQEIAGTPTANLLGWGPATTLTPEQRSIIETSDIFVDNFNAVNLQFQFNKKLFEQVSDRVTQAEAKIKLGTALPGSARGSITQLQWQERDRGEHIAFNRRQQYSEGTVRQINYCAHDKRITLGALMWIRDGRV
ncbi:hypothetical protein C0J52_11753 [Blattella germanica]|nr:hypothetical protein C0J52_11753 [Blattella germanica]